MFYLVAEFVDLDAMPMVQGASAIWFDFSPSIIRVPLHDS